MGKIPEQFNPGAFPDPVDDKDYKYEDIAFGSGIFDWENGYDVEEELDITIPFKDQDGSSSCVGQAWAYYTAVLNTVETGYYQDVSSKAIYSQIYLADGGAYIRNGGAILKDYGALFENVVSSYENGTAPSEKFMRDIGWKNKELNILAKILSAKDYRSLSANRSIDIFADAISKYRGVVVGVYGENNGTWSTNEPKPPTDPAWGHALWFGKAGTDEKGKYIATPNSWGVRGKDSQHKDGWQKLREDYFTNNYIFSPWTLTDKPNSDNSVIATTKIMKEYEKKIVIEGDAPGRKGIIINGKLREITKTRAAEACLYVLANNGLGVTVSKAVFDVMPKEGKF